jgi:hypothetical protein
MAVKAQPEAEPVMGIDAHIAVKRACGERWSRGFPLRRRIAGEDPDGTG